MGLLDKLFGGKKAESAGTTITYRSGPSDTCRSLAKTFYGSEAEWERIYKENEWRLKEEVQSGSDKLLPGTELTIKDPKFDATGAPISA